VIAGRCEELLSAITKRPYSYLTNSCTTALHALLHGLGIGEGDAVFVTSYSWQATANVIELVGATPVFVDIDALSFNINPSQLELAIRRIEMEASLRPALILVVHAFGRICEMREINAISQTHGIPIVEDAACALGASVAGTPAGSFGVAAAFSFHPRKIVSTGEGGAFVTSSEMVHAKATSFSDHGRTRPGSADFDKAGSNYRFSEFSAAMLLPQLEKLDTLVANRRTLARRYIQDLKGLPGFCPIDTNEANCWQSFVYLLPEDSNRSLLIEAGKCVGIEIGTGTVAIPYTSYFQKKYSIDSTQFPALSGVHKRAISLPIYDGLSSSNQEKVIQFLRDFLQ
jgi:dTDP-4-amino-4,6-dideoxygalactose transaminase